MEIKSSAVHKAINQSFVLQQEQRDCGIACLLSLIRYYSGDATLDNLRRISGTNTTGTTMLGLYEAATTCGFIAQGCQADMDALVAHEAPVILHLIMESGMYHYVVAYGRTMHKGQPVFVIGDPGQGIRLLDQQQLEQLWQTRICLVLEPGPAFVTTDQTQGIKKQWLRELVKGDIPLLMIASAIGLIIAGLNLVMAVFSQRLIDDILPAKDYSRFGLGIVMVLLLLIIKDSANGVRQILLLKQGRDFNNRMTETFFASLLQLPKPFFDTRTTGELIARLTDTSRVQKLIATMAGNVVIDLLVVLVSIGFLFAYSWQTALIAMGVMPLYYLLIHKHSRAIVLGQRSVMAGYAICEGSYINTLQGIGIIKSHNKQQVFSNLNRARYGQYQQSIYGLGKIQVRLGWLAGVAGNTFLVVILAYGTRQVFDGQLKAGALMAVIGICATLLPAIANLALVAIPFSEAKVAFDRMFEFTSISKELLPTDPVEGIAEFRHLSIKDISFRYPGRSPLLKQVSFEVSRGEIIAIMGENGSGKSTLSQILQGFYRYQTGQVLLNDTISLDSIVPERWRHTLAVVPQYVHLFNGTILDNIAFESAVHPQEVIVFLESLGLMSSFQVLPQGIFTLVGEEGINLSGGQQQLVALARALYRKPSLLIMDEGTAAMDRDLEQFCLQLLDNLKQSMAVIFISHRLHVLKSFCDRIYILQDGFVRDYGSHQELLESDNLYSKYWQDVLG